MTLYVYAGANGKFTIYEDEGTNYDYEKGAFAEIPIEWNDATHMLTIGKRVGSFAGMLQSRTFQLVLVSQQKPVGYSPDVQPAQTVQYKGEAASVKLN